MSKIHRLNLSDEEGNGGEDDDDERRYVGGTDGHGGGSGLNVVAPKDMLNRAQREGQAVDADDYYKKRNSAFGGRGAKLSSGEMVGQERERIIAVKFYKNGFTVNDGPLRNGQTPEDKNFMKSMNDGYVPSELQAAGQAIPVLDVQDMSKEEYKPPPAAMFSGRGNVIGGSQVKPVGAPISSSIYYGQVNESEPVTEIRVRLHNGTTVKGRFNHSQTVDHLFQFTKASLPLSHGVQFQLLSGYPRKPLDNPSLSVKDAGLINGSVFQTLV